MNQRKSRIPKANPCAHTLLYAFTLLALHPTVQDTLFNEIKQKIGTRLPTYEDFPKLVYPLCVMYETLRLFPPAITLPKCSQYSDETLLGKYFIPKDTTIELNVVYLHRNPKFWGDDAESFNPSRFDGRASAEKIAQIETADNALGGTNDKIRMPVKGAFIPFAEGPRSCLG